MTDIDVPDWVVEDACKNAWPQFRSGMETEIWEFADAARRDRLREITRAVLRAALSAWVVPALWRTRMVSIGDGFVYPWMDDEDPEIWAARAKRYTPAESLRVEQCTLYALRQEKPE